MNHRLIEVNDRMRRGYVYHLTEPTGKNFHPDFAPDLAPKQMLELGVFGGKYMTDCAAEFPADWFGNARSGASPSQPLAPTCDLQESAAISRLRP